jgi:peptide/nickel transport system ATP-binding protein/oligopeptide transport system ATP-binding protein
VPSPADPPPACRFHTRCPWATEVCREVEPPLRDFGQGRVAACHHPRNVTDSQAASAQVVPESPESAGDARPKPAVAPA